MKQEHKDLNEALMEAVIYHRVAEVKKLLEQGANPNYYRATSENETNELHQPNTPLRLIMFCISDNLLEDKDLKDHAENAKLLLQYGADPKPAIALAESRYGKYVPEQFTKDNIFDEIYRIVATAQRKENSSKPLPPADQPDWGGPYNWAWFKFHHLNTLKKHFTAIEKQSEQHSKTPYTPEEIKKFLSHLEALIKLYDWLPDSGGGQEAMKLVIKKKKEYESAYYEKSPNPGSYWDAQKIVDDVALLYNYMDACCEDE
jgi:hypothetical protein